ncbi:MAG: hypothetical protein JXX14_20615 [Deltaproteobacteria bacterium]|nr:hypothetical protein [Deltaproteobacteria bacterium]
MRTAESSMMGREAAPHSVRLCLGYESTRERREQGLGIVAKLLRESNITGDVLL